MYIHTQMIFSDNTCHVVPVCRALDEVVTGVGRVGCVHRCVMNIYDIRSHMYHAGIYI